MIYVHTCVKDCGECVILTPKKLISNLVGLNMIIYMKSFIAKRDTLSAIFDIFKVRAPSYNTK